MLGVLAILLTVYLCGRHNDKVEEKNKKLTKSNKSTNFSSGYDPVRQVHWTKRDTWDISN